MDNKIEMRRISDLKPYKNNPRKNDKAVDAVAASIKAFGFKQPVVIDDNGEIIAGHTRVKAAKKAGYHEVPCIIASDLTPEQVKAYRLADNKVGELAEWDFNSLDRELAELEQMAIDMLQYGFEQAYIDEEEYGEDFSLPCVGKSEYQTMTFTLHHKQAELVNAALAEVGECSQTYGNTNKNGNALYEVVKEWAKQKR